MMPDLHIDFGQRQQRPARAGIALLGVALALTFVAVLHFWFAQATRERQDAALDAQRHATFFKSHAPKAVLTPAQKLAQTQGAAVLRELTVPWQDLLSIVEDYRNQDVALIGIDQNPALSQIRITAEAKNLDAMVAYLRYLQTSVLLRQAVLNGHLVETNVPGNPVRFQITAVWGKS
ncbi:hypothetical protein [Paraburkholderia adhaesiva]|uniref:hypothetical protein n=1 Tax=Paraburkholderia adhaesiva TaxID=2883244 RepID=UPI001F197984|nr:hypothetical protein [Paraburkholderia adhaesiva]